VSDLILQLVVGVSGLISLFIGRKVSGVWLNPVSILFFCFFAPLFFALFRLSTLQSASWEYETYIAIWGAFGAWLLFPVIVLSMAGKVNKVDLKLNFEILDSKEFTFIVRFFSFVVLLSYLAGNYIQTGSFFPILHPELAYEVHTVFPPVIRLFARANPAAALLLYFVFWRKRSSFDLLLLMIMVVLPLSRLSRIDVALTLVGLTILFSVIPIFKMNVKRIALLLAGFVVLAVGGAELGNQRTNRFGMYEVDYSQAIGWMPEFSGPGGVFATAYGYFPLSFENFDQFVRQFNGAHMIGLYSFDWLFSGVVKINWIGGYSAMRATNAAFDPVSSAANVPTALFPFYADFGPVGIVLPMMLYVGVWIYFFYKSRSSFLFLLLWALYSGGFALSSFQALIAAPVLVQQLIEVALVFWMAKNLSRWRARRELGR